MSMTPQEEFDKQVWEILQDIKGDLLAGETGKPLTYFFPRVQGVGIIPNRRRRDIIYKLQEWEAIKIENDATVDGLPSLKYMVLQPKFDEIYQKYELSQALHTPPDKEEEAELVNEINEWLDTRDQHALGRIWQVVNALSYEWQLRDETTFNVPHDKFQRNKINSKEDLEAILSALHRKRFLLVIKMVFRTKPDPNSDKPQGSVWTTITDNPAILYDTHTKITLVPKRFKPLVEALRARVHPEEKEKPSQSNNPENPETIWSDKLAWDGKKKFLIGERGDVEFNAESSDRISLFRMLTEAKGKWVPVKEMAEKVKKPERDVRVVMGQIQKEMLHDKVIEIVPRNEKGEQGAYRIELLIPPNRL